LIASRDHYSFPPPEISGVQGSERVKVLNLPVIQQRRCHLGVCYTAYYSCDAVRPTDAEVFEQSYCSDYTRWAKNRTIFRVHNFTKVSVERRVICQNFSNFV